MIQDPKAVVAAAGSAIAMVPVVLATLFPGLKTGHMILVIAGIVVTAVLSYLGLWLFKQQTIRDQATAARLDEKFKELRDELKEIREFNAGLDKLLQAMVIKYDNFSKQLAAIEADVKEAERRLDLGRNTISDLKSDVAVLKSKAAGYTITRGPNDVVG